MKDIEEKARAFAKKLTFENRYKFYDEPNVRTSEYLSYKAYLAGYQEAKRWREIKELTKEDGIVLLKTWHENYLLGYFYEELITSNKIFRIESITHWRPI